MSGSWSVPDGITQIDLTPFICQLRERLSKAHLASMANSLQARTFVDPILGGMFIELQAWCARNVAPSSVDYVEVPYDWWEAVRERWAPKWWLMRHPVITRRIDVEYFRVCPHADLPWQDPHRSHIDWLMVRGMKRDDIVETPKA